jgi:hypothetical protein
MKENKCEECGETLEPVPELGGDCCRNCQIFHTPYGFENNWEIR